VIMDFDEFASLL